jgi:hypothetical protein
VYKYSDVAKLAILAHCCRHVLALYTPLASPVSARLTGGRWLLVAVELVTSFSFCISFLCVYLSFVCAAGASKSVYGTTEALCWNPNSEDLACICGKAFTSALERDCLTDSPCLLALLVLVCFLRVLKPLPRSDIPVYHVNM